MKKQHLLMTEISRKERKEAKDVMLSVSETSHILYRLPPSGDPSAVASG